jgi:hypothetical protein
MILDLKRDASQPKGHGDLAKKWRSMLRHYTDMSDIE